MTSRVEDLGASCVIALNRVALQARRITPSGIQQPSMHARYDRSHGGAKRRTPGDACDGGLGATQARTCAIYGSLLAGRTNILRCSLNRTARSLKLFICIFMHHGLEKQEYPKILTKFDEAMQFLGVTRSVAPSTHASYSLPLRPAPKDAPIGR